MLELAEGNFRDRGKTSMRAIKEGWFTMIMAQANSHRKLDAR